MRTDRSRTAPRPHHAGALLAIIVVSTLIRSAAALVVPLLDDEAHYWVWSRHLMWGYPDHPPMIAALVAVGTWLLGDSAPGIRLFPVLLGTASTVVLYVLTRRLFSPSAGLRAALLFQVLPAFAAGGIIAAPDAPLGFFWLAAMLFGWMATRGVGWAWPAAGAAVGLAVQSKLAGGALALSLAGFVLTTPSGRGWLRTRWPYLAAATGALVLVPLVRWNAAHEWATLTRALVVDPWIEPMTAPANVAAFVGSQFVYYGPLGFPILLAALAAVAARARRDDRFRLLLWGAAPTLLVVALSSTRALAKPHYTAPALLSALIAAVALWPQWRPQRLLRAGVLTSLAVTLAAIVLAAVPTPVSSAFHQEAAGWHQVACEIERVAPTLGRPGEVFVLAETYQAGSQIAFALQERLPVVVPFRGFVLWQPPARWVGRNGVLVDHLAGAPFDALSGAFERLESPFVVPIGAGRAVRLYPGINFRGLGGSP
ncbi:MAG: glycosyltransferase family 39 protein [Armatimonadota bacterium]|nr:glycosyltransferase family 39 protein [Armatimonadota bacterium]MDR7549676.1 glycosyltransferase family 39 protein [Armatimonadota bacterium]